MKPNSISGPAGGWVRLTHWIWNGHPPSTVWLVLSLFALGALAALLLMLLYGALGTDRIAADIIARVNDVENYGRHRGAGTLDALGPVYGPVVARNVTLPALLSSLLFQLTASDLAVRIVFGTLYGALFAAAIPFLLHGLQATRLTTSGFCLIGIWAYALASNEHIYGFFPFPLITGIAATGLFSLTLGCCLLGKVRVAGMVAGLHLLIHPTTALAWLPLSLAGLAHRLGWLKPAQLKGGYAALALLPVLGGFLAVGLERFGIVFGTADPASYWALLRVRAVHTIFWGTERYDLTVTYLGMLLALFLLARSESHAKMRHLAMTTACYGTGIFILYALFVESEASMLAAVLLPLRFAAPIYLILVVFLLSDLLRPDGVRFETRLLAGFMCISLLSPVPGNPLTAIWNWALARLYFEGAYSARKSLGLGLGFTLLAWVLLTVLPQTGDTSQLLPLIDARAPWLLRAYGAVLPASTLTSQQVKLMAYLGAMVFAVVAVRSIAAFEIRVMRRWLSQRVGRGAVWCGVAVAALLVTVVGLFNTFPLGRLRGQLAYLALPSQTRPASAEAQVLDWLNDNVAPGTRIMGDPNVYFRRVFPGNFVTDDDLLSVVTYAPDLAARVVREYHEVYDVDMHALARSRTRILEVMSSDRWVAARDRMLHSSIDNTRVIVEPTSHPLSSVRAPVFTNSGYRVYEIP